MTSALLHPTSLILPHHLTHFAPLHPCLVEMMGTPEPTQAQSVPQNTTLPHQVSHQRNESDLLYS